MEIVVILKKQCNWFGKEISVEKIFYKKDVKCITKSHKKICCNRVLKKMCTKRK